MKRKNHKKRRVGWIVALIIMLCIACFTGYMAINACCVHLMRATVGLEDLPPAFEGTTILFASDIDLGGINTPKRAAEVFNRLQVLQPDMLILGGDYTSPTLADLINQNAVTEFAANKASIRRDFFYYIRDFYAPLGKYMIASADDPDIGALQALADETGFKLLRDDAAEIKQYGYSIYVVGMDPVSNGAAKLASKYSRGDCVIALAASPSQFPSIMTAEASDSGHWIDLALSGHTHGGQIMAFGHSILSLDAREQQFLHGWNRETGVPMLVTSGLGCEGVNLRLGSQAEIWLITLTDIQGE